jgi:hypothetical protein
VVLNTSTKLSHIDTYSIIEKLLSFGFIGVKIAFVLNNVKTIHKVNVCVNNVNVFFSSDMAKKWLKTNQVCISST